MNTSSLVTGVIIGAAVVGTAWFISESSYSETGTDSGSSGKIEADTCFIKSLESTTYTFDDSITAAKNIELYQTDNPDTLWGISITKDMMKAAVDRLLTASELPTSSSLGGVRYYVSSSGSAGFNYMYMFPLDDSGKLITGLGSTYKVAKIKIADAFCGPCPDYCD